MEKPVRILVLLSVVYILVDVIQVPAEKITFTFFNETRTWNEAYCICINYGMSLLVIDSEEKTDIFNMVQADMGDLVAYDEGIWIGLFNTVIYKWINGEKLGNWPPLPTQKPKKISTDLCVKFSGNKWKTKVCSDSYRFVCEAKQDLCSMESNYSSPSVLDFPAVRIISTEMQCVQQCEKNNSCYAVIHNNITNECSVYNAVNNLDFVKSGNRTGIAYRKICYEGHVAEDDTGYIDKGGIPQLTCTFNLLSAIETISTISSMTVTDYINPNESVPFLTELYYLNESIVSSSNPIITFSPTMTTFDPVYSPDIFPDSNSFLSTQSVTLLSMVTTSNYITETNTIATKKDVAPISSSVLQSSQTATSFEIVTSSSTNFQSASLVTPALDATVNSAIIITPTSSFKRIIPQKILSLCGCNCRSSSLGLKVGDTGKAIRNLPIAKNTTSSYRRQKTSANNTSISSVIVGSFGIIIVSVVLGCIFVSDAVMMRKHLCDRKGGLL